ncbi:MAG: uridine kinase [Deltaproteobacteria bacterium]|nr:MAG: uridine kinase [Deltaproteobacteria bacterium]
MSKLVTGDGRTHIESKLMRESLQDRGVVAGTDSSEDLKIFPDVALVSIGGQSIFDRGRDAIVPLAEELGALHASRKHKIIVGVGGGTRVRHTAAVALDLGIPTGGIAQLVGAMEELNAIMLNTLLAKHGSTTMPRDHFWDLPLYFSAGILPIVISVPPYHFWEPPAREGALPEHGSDFGLFQIAEVLALGKLIYVKDEDGLYDKDPKKHDDAVLIRKTTLAEILANPPLESILDRAVFEQWRDAKNVKRIQIVNGLVPGQLTAALEGEDVGTVITKE